MDPRWEKAIRHEDCVALAAQLDAGADVDSLDRYGQSALMLAVTHGYLEVVRLLIVPGADLDRTAKYGLSATMLATINRHEVVARTIAEAGADLSLVGSGAPGFAGKNASQLARDRGLHELADALGG